MPDQDQGREYFRMTCQTKIKGGNTLGWHARPRSREGILKDDIPDQDQGREYLRMTCREDCTLKEVKVGNRSKSYSGTQPISTSI